VALNNEMKIYSMEAFTNVTQCGNLEDFMHIIRFVLYGKNYLLLLQWQFIFLDEESEFCFQVEARA